MYKLSKLDIEIIINCVRQGETLSDMYKEVLFKNNAQDDDDGNEPDVTQSLKKRTQDKSLGSLISVSSAMKDVFNTIKKVAHNNLPVLIVGEKGTGKKTVARTIHDLGPTNTGQFIVIDCGSLSEHDFDMKIFGRDGGKTLNGHTQKKGLIELAQGGTIYFNQIAELALPLQAKLISFFRDNTIMTSNNFMSTPINARIISSSDIDLASACNQDKFRKDIYYLINTISIQLPTLREREGDVFLLAKAFLDRYSIEYDKRMKGLTLSARDALFGHSWPGNVIELENRIKRAVILAEGKKITASDLGLEENNVPHRPMALKMARQSFEKKLIVESIARHDGSLTKAATELDISRPTLYDLMVKYNIPK